ncbi:NgoPII family restriction endonuclease [Fenollaria timonensis]|jgi:hypothetical protein|uniref:NgoPII family restriction endonuclease n=1 Tax=Fenollaria timonensis TaxID=1723384 RepID=UPI00071D2FDC|nr:NgoPII family restriction endonuclease [Fenollaria timonensis]
MANIINAIINIVENPKLELRKYSSSHNRVNSVGEALEEYIKDAFAGTINENNENKRNEVRSKIFSYLGNQNNPPDCILRDGDAIEIKKIESDTSNLALNSSYPKNKLFANSPMINNSCRNCEQWNVKDMIYTVGVVKNGTLKALAFVYGSEYCADNVVYERVRNTIKEGIGGIDALEFADTRELGRVNRVDPLGISFLRVRGMWGIKNPFETFDYIYKKDKNKKFNLMAIINEEKYYSFNNYKDLEKIINNNLNADISNVKIKDPNNPAKLKTVKLINFSM